MNIIHVRSCSDRGGGPDKTIRLSCINLMQLGHKCSAYYLHGNTEDSLAPVPLLKSYGVDAEALQFSGHFNFKGIGALQKILRQYDQCIYHAHDYKSEIFGVLASWTLRERVALVTTIHGVILNNWKLHVYEWLAGHSLRFFDKVIVVTNSQIPYIAQFGVSLDKIEVVYNAIRLVDYETSSLSLAPDTSDNVFACIPRDAKVILFLGRLSVEKGGHIALRVLRQLAIIDPSFYLVFVGTGPQSESLCLMADELGIRDKVQFAGYQQDVRPFLKKCHILLVPSLSEGLPNSILEAQAMFVPVVASAVGGVTDIIEHEYNGFLVRPGCIDQYVQYILLLSHNNVIRERIIQNAHRKLEEHFEFGKHMERMMWVYNSLYASKKWKDAI